MDKKRLGFTLAELLIVIVILGILGGIALPRFFPQAEKGRVAEAIAMLSAIRQGQEAYRLERGFYLDLASGGDWKQIGMEDPNDNDNTFFTYKVDASGTTFTATAKRKDGAYVDDTVSIDNNGTWNCTHPFGPTDD